MRAQSSILAPAAEWTKPQLIRSMLGNDAKPATQRRKSQAQSPVAVSIRNLRAPGVDLPALDIHAGEIVGLAGLVGSGRTRLLRTIAGAESVREGEVTLNGRLRPWPRSPRNAIRAGIALAPEDRKEQGLVLERSGGWNVALGQFQRAAAGRPLHDSRALAWAAPAAVRMGFDPTGRYGTIMKDVPDTPIAAEADRCHSIGMRRVRQPLYAQQNRYFPELVAAIAAAVPSGRVIDGEAVIWTRGRLDFSALQQRLGAGPKTLPGLVRETPANYTPFDLLAVAGHDTRELPLHQRGALLEELSSGWRPPLSLSPPPTDPEVVARWFEELPRTGIEGLMINSLLNERVDAVQEVGVVIQAVIKARQRPPTAGSFRRRRSVLARTGGSFTASAVPLSVLRCGLRPYPSSSVAGSCG